MTTNVSIAKPITYGILLTIVSGLVLLIPGNGRAWLLDNDDLEKPEPEFHQEGSKFISKLLPRGKNTSVLIAFEAEGGEIENLKGVDFETAEHPLVDYKDFRSALFELSLSTPTTGQEVELTIGSEFFTTATEFWAYNAGQDPPWINTKANAFSKQKVYVDLVFKIKDGGLLDSDGKADGKIILLGGPRDSFWGYAMGTLFIRFFGVFMVLIALMIGMIFFGKIFTYLDTRKPSKSSSGHTPPAEPVCPKAGGEELSPELAAAVVLAINLHTDGTRPKLSRLTSVQGVGCCSWVQQGREQLMGSRLSAFQRMKR